MYFGCVLVGVLFVASLVELLVDVEVLGVELFVAVPEEPFEFVLPVLLLLCELLFVEILLVVVFPDVLLIVLFEEFGV